MLRFFISYYLSVVTIALSCIVFHIQPDIVVFNQKDLYDTERDLLAIAMLLVCMRNISFK